MKTLFLLRHAEAAPSESGGDYERRLTQGGFEAARKLGSAMHDKGYTPAFVMCSGATRTRETLAAVMESITGASVEYDKEIYHATRGELFQIIQQFNDKYDSALVVGHNPAIHELAATLAAEEPQEHLEKLARGYAPGTLTVFKVPRAKWEDLQPGENRLENLIGN